jgi:hypothetical protein
LWRRLACIAFEDVGLADIDTVATVTAVVGKKFREFLGGEWATASFLVSKMADAPKCRAADDLLIAAESHPNFEDARLQFAFRNTQDLIRIATGADPLPIRALAAWYGLGTDRRPSPRLSLRQGDPTGLFSALREIIPPAVVEIAREGFRKTGEVLCPFFALLCPLRQHETTVIVNDKFPPEMMIGDIPGWSYDLYSREGRRALGVFLEGDSETARWVRAHIPSPQRVSFLGGIVFRVEGGAVKSRLRWATGDELRRQVDVECNGPHCPDATEILQLVRDGISALNEVRLRLNGGAIQ